MLTKMLSWWYPNIEKCFIDKMNQCERLMLIKILITLINRQNILFDYNHGHDIIKQLKILVEVPFTTSKVVLDI